MDNYLIQANPILSRVKGFNNRLFSGSQELFGGSIPFIFQLKYTIFPLQTHSRKKSKGVSRKIGPVIEL